MVEQEETQLVGKEKKRFFRRLLDAFHPQKKDSDVINRHSTQMVTTDTLMQTFNAGDTLAQILSGIEKDVEQSAARHRQRVNAQTQKLRYAGIELNARVTDLLESIENEEQARIQTEAEKEYRVKRQAAITTASIAIVAVLLAVVFFIIVWRDLIRNNRLRKELEKAKEKAEELMAAREKLMLTVTHDIKAPVSAIMGYADLLQPYIKDRKPENYLHNIQSSSAHLQNLVVSLLDYHKLESHLADRQTVSFNPSELIHAVADSFRPATQYKKLELRCETSPSTDRICLGDALRIRQVAENLTGNALKFTRHGHVVLKADMQGESLMLTVQDTGCGMSEEEQRTIFKAFTRLKSAQGEEGVGLGLSITQKIIELLDGEIHVESRQGEGSTFRVLIPLQTSGDEVPHKRSKATPTIHEPLSVLVIDDDRIQLQLMEAILEQIKEESGSRVQEWNIACCTDPEEVFRLLADEQFDLILTDIQMPALNGFELVHRLQNVFRSTGIRIPIIAITARQDMDEEYFRQHGFATCLYKPFHRHDLILAIRKATGAADNKLHISQSPSPPPKASATPDFIPLTDFAGDDKEAAHEILTTFMQETEQNAVQIQEAYTRKDKAEICRLAHKLLPTFTLIGASCTEALRMMEERKAEAGWNPEDEAPVWQIINGIQEVIAALQTHPAYKNI